MDEASDGVVPMGGMGRLADAIEAMARRLPPTMTAQAPAPTARRPARPRMATSPVPIKQR